jgi:hypothetical protein
MRLQDLCNVGKLSWPNVQRVVAGSAGLEFLEH